MSSNFFAQTQQIFFDNVDWEMVHQYKIALKPLQLVIVFKRSVYQNI